MPEPVPKVVTPKDTLVVAPKDTIEEPEIDTLEIMFPEIRPDTLNIAYVLPFFYDEKDTLFGLKRRLHEISFEFYQGSLIALDTLRDCGYHLNVFVYDSRNSKSELDKIRYRLLENKIHLVFGPLFQENIAYLSDFVKKHKINVVSPLATHEACPDDNPYLFMSNPSIRQFGKAAADLANKEFASITPVVIRQANETEARLSDYFVENIDLLLMDSLREIVYRRDEWHHKPINANALGKTNFIFIPSRDEPFVTNMFTYLRMVEGNHTVIGLDRWQHFSRIDGVLWNRFNVHLLGSYYVDFDHPDAILFVRKYRKEYHTEPSEFAFRGFDETIKYANRIIEHGVYFQRNYYEENTIVSPNIVQGLHKQYNLQPFSDNCSAWENNFIHILRFRNFRLRPLE